VLLGYYLDDIPPSAAHSFGLFVCDLKHKVAVWQAYALIRVYLKGAESSRRAKIEEGPCARRADPE
jgi:hypothetical protein